MAQDIEALAHRIGWLENNFKQYVSGNTYNGIELTVGTSVGTIDRGVVIPYKTIGGDIRLRFNVSFSVPAANPNVTITQISLKPSMTHVFGASCSNDGTVTASWALSTNNILSVRNTGTISGIFGDIELALWPPWADVF